MKLKKRTIIKIVEKMEGRIMTSLKSPSSDGYMPTPDPAQIAAFEGANLVGIASAILMQFPNSYLDKEAFDQFINKFIATFEASCPVSQTTVHYACDYSASCHVYLRELLNREWPDIEEANKIFRTHSLKTGALLLGMNSLIQVFAQSEYSLPLSLIATVSACYLFQNIARQERKVYRDSFYYYKGPEVSFSLAKVPSDVIDGGAIVFDQTCQRLSPS